MTESLRGFKRLPDLPEGTYLIILAAAIYGLTIVLTKGALEQIPPFTLLCIQTASSVLVLWTIIIFQGIQVPLEWNTLKLSLIGLLEPGLSYVFAVFGLSLTTASNSTFINTTEPIVTIALSWLILRERINFPLIGLGLLACVGVAFISIPNATSIGQGSIWGDLLVCLSVLFASLYAVTAARSVQRLHLVALAAIQQSVALILFMIMLLGALFLGLESFEFVPAMWGSLLIAVTSGAFGYGLAFLLYLAAVRYLPASRLSLYLTLTPVFGVISAYLILGERLLVSQGLGGSLILLAVVSISRVPHE
ncbi:DMT family transporter [Gloeocapsopsis crepidinum LEGE 06123]|uniref:DMT family transporter n=1 Tax=Gloeocapsopsis crepidinum LEGE 06123 TaxID=588587 RepID=A0ABR9ULQ6_9CHRO|nr:DMT family transporter [Gloeocapsopsis crepidinum]MBE9189221.1 DMT family transporter [Gloeocapsopsis crepidinum LEGE 06123]